VRAGLLLVALLPAGAARAAEEPVFDVHTAAGTSLRGPLLKLDADWSVQLGKGADRRVSGKKVVSLRRRGVALPALPSDEHVILVNGDRIPVKEVRVEDERLYFSHADLNDGKETSVPLEAVAVYWRAAPERTAVPEKLRRRLAAGTRTRDTVLLRNGDVLAGVLKAVDGDTVEVEANRKKSRAKLGQVAAIALSSDLANALRPKGVYARLVLSDTPRAPGGRLSLTAAHCADGKTLRGKTVFGARVRVPLGRVLALDLYGGRAVYLSDLKPSKYDYRPYLDERWPWCANRSVTGRDLRLGGSTYDKGIGMHSHSLLTYRLGGAYQRFEALVGLDDLDGRRGKARVRVLADGKPLALPAKGELTAAGGPLAINVKVAGVKELTLEVGWGADGLVQGVVNWADARLIK
jgi:hypothetical protein